jgi:hypothetical protein
LLTLMHWPLLRAVINAYLLVATFQLSYLVGAYVTQRLGTNGVPEAFTRRM